MNAVFADTFYFLALVNRHDESHEKCVRFSESFDQPIVTTTWILLELGDALRRPRDREAFSVVVKQLGADPATTIVAADQDTFSRALALFNSRPDKEWSLTDCTSFVVMSDRGLSQALTQDHHFEQAGFTALFK